MQKRANLDVLVTVGSVSLTMISLLIASFLREQIAWGRPLMPGDNAIPLLLYAIVACIWLAMLLLTSVQRLLRTAHVLEGLWRLVLAVLISDLLFAGTLYLFYRELPRLVFVYFSLVDLCTLVCFFLMMRWLISHQARERRPQRHILIAGAGASGIKLAQVIDHEYAGASEIVGFLDNDPTLRGQHVQGWPVLGSLDEAPAVVRQAHVDEVIVALSLQDHPAAVQLVRQLQPLPVHIRLVPDFLDFAVIRASVDYLEGMPIVGLRVPALSDEARLYKRLFDILISSVLLLLLSPLLLVIAVLIKLDSRGSSFLYSQRIGENGQPFQMLKFRSMVSDAEQRWHEVITRGEDGKLRFKHPSDPRITRVGAWLRRTSLDELPQLWNVLRGEMSMVGPRPELPLIVEEEYEPWQWSRFTVPQGMTGWWQINRRGFEHQHLCTADDLYYIQNYSLQLDLLILLKTVGVVLRGQGAY